MDTLLVNMLDVNLSIQSFHQYMYFSTQFENTVIKAIVCAQQLLTHSPFYHIIGMEAWRNRKQGIGVRCCNVLGNLQLCPLYDHPQSLNGYHLSAATSST